MSELVVAMAVASAAFLLSAAVLALWTLLARAYAWAGSRPAVVVLAMLGLMLGSALAFFGGACR